MGEKLTEKFQDILFLAWSGESINKSCSSVEEKKKFLKKCNDLGIRVESKIGILPTNKEITTEDMYGAAKRGIYANASINPAWAKLAVQIMQDEKKDSSKIFTTEDYEKVIIDKFTVLKGKKNEDDNDNQAC